MLYLVAGMNRSGSTWLFNAVRLLLVRSGARDVGAGWVTERTGVLRHETAVLKVHQYDASLLAERWPCAVLVSHRDPRDVLASMIRKFRSDPSATLLRHVVEEYRQWSRHAVYDMAYERMIADGVGELRRVGMALGIGDGVDHEALLAELEGLATSISADAERGFDPTSLLHAGHITDGRHGSWRDELPVGLVEEIERELGDWMGARGYLTTVG